jgi:hypothetical protein
MRDTQASQAFHRNRLGIRFRDMDSYLNTEAMNRDKTFALWTLDHAARSCFGRSRRPARVTVPQVRIEFNVSNVATASKELERRGYRPLVSIRTEPSSQVVNRMLGPERLLVGLTYAP